MRATLTLPCALLLAAGIHADPAAAQTATTAPTPVAKIDPSLLPGIRADLQASCAEVKVLEDKRASLKRDFDSRMAEKARWQAQIADVDKAKAQYEKAMAAHHADALDHYTQFQAHEALRASLNPHNDGQRNAFNAEVSRLNAWQYNLDAERARLDQAKADYLQRYDTINKQIDALDDYMNGLIKQFKEASHVEISAREKGVSIAKVLAAQGETPSCR